MRAAEAMSRRDACPVCGGKDSGTLLDLESVPVLSNAMATTREAALAARAGRVALVHCPGCGHIFNHAFDPKLLNYSSDYENSLHFSDTFSSYSDALIEDLVERFGLNDRSVVEVGCGAGEFLKALCAAGGNRGVGFDRAAPGGGDDRVRFVSEYITSDTPRCDVDFLVARHVLEHLGDPGSFLVELRQWLGPGADCGFYFEVPNAHWTLERGGIWDVIYEHPSYFSPKSLLRLVRTAGFEPEEWGEAFGGQYLQVMGKVRGIGSTESVTHEGPEPLESERGLGSGGLVHGFGFRFETTVEEWERWVRTVRRNRKSVALWGAGSKGVTFLNLLDPGPGVRFVVDINPRKQGRFVPVTGHEILPPESLKTDPPDIVLVANPLYKTEIQTALNELGVKAEVVGIGEVPP